MTAKSPVPTADMFKVTRDVVRLLTTATATGRGYCSTTLPYVAVVVVLPGVCFSTSTSEVIDAVHTVDVAIQVLLAAESLRTTVLRTDEPGGQWGRGSISARRRRRECDVSRRKAVRLCGRVLHDRR